MNTLKNFFDNLPVVDYKPIRNEIVKRHGISRTTFSGWRNGKYQPNKAAQLLINQVLESYNYPKIYEV